MFKINWDIHLLGRPISPYVSLAVIGMFLGITIAIIIAKERGLTKSFVFRMIASVLFIGVVSQIFVETIPRYMLSFAYLIGLILATFLYIVIGWIFHKDPRATCEVGLISTNTFMIFSKLGCFFTGCCHGNPTESIFSVIYYPSGHALLTDVTLFPIQLVSSFVRTLFLVIMLVMYYKKSLGTYRVPLFFTFLGLAYFWEMFLWYPPFKTVNQFGVNYIAIFATLFGISAISFIILGNKKGH